MSESEKTSLFPGEAPPRYEVATSQPANATQVYATALASNEYGYQQHTAYNPYAVTTQPQPVYHVIVSPPNYYVKSYLFVSIITTFLCVWPIGIVAIILSAASRSAYLSGDEQKGQSWARGALGVNIFNIVSGITLIILLFTLIIPSMNDYDY
ncbi:proline-rich transmembrane protein 1-like isoform X2 [Oscarella lobularis]|uniref:proline-rich transmembrane protein 1-like isoform X2 n=1 Tax=Oscarella lobularis TaxID=121494 RepID=UPI003313D8A5